MPNIDRIIANLPDYFPKDPSTDIYKILDAISKEADIIDDNIQYLDNLLEVNTTSGIDLDKIYGNIYDINRYIDESDEDYRLRLNTAFLSQKGGTSDIIQFAISLTLGIDTTDQVAMDDAVLIEDAWIYDPTGTKLPSNNFGESVCVLNSSFIPSGVDDTVLGYAVDIVNRCKASGVRFYVIYVLLYTEIDVNISVDVEQETMVAATFPIEFPTVFGVITKEVL